MSKRQSKTRHEVVKKSEKNNFFSQTNIIIFLVIGLLILGITLGVVLTKNKAKSSSTDSYNGKKLVITEYSDFQCPFCKRANDDAVAKIKKNFGEAVEFEFKHFPLSFHPNAQKAAEASECARDQGKFWEMHDKMFLDQSALAVANLKKYAKELSLDTAKFDACLDTGAKAALVASQMSEGQKLGVQGTPAFFINGQLLSGAQPYESFLPLICKQIPTHTACVNAPKPVSFKMYVVEDSRCTDCDSSRIVAVTQQLFSGIEVVKVDYNSAQGKELYAKMGVTYLPMYVMEKTVADDPSFSKIQQAMVQKDNYYAINPQAVGASFDPNGEICTNSIDDNADGVVDCKDPKCAASLECRTELKNDIQVFIMSDCPYGKKAVEALKEAKDNLAGMQFSIHYIASDNGDGTFNSLHGAYEAEENIRQLCAKDLAPSKYFDYTYCRSVNGIRGVDYTACANSAGIDAVALKTCTDGDKGKNLLKEDIKIAEALGIQASPTWLANNRYQFSGIDAETIKQNYCKYNPGAAGCDKTLSTNSGAPAGNCG